MAFQVYLVFEDNQRDLADEFDDLGDAVSLALELADEIGLRPVGDGHGPPRDVIVYNGHQIEISVRIIRGGLLSRADDTRLRSR